MLCYVALYCVTLRKFLLSCTHRNNFSPPNSHSYNSNVFQLPEGRMLTYFNIVPEGSILDVPNAGEIL